jgi:hypothetical protein
MGILDNLSSLPEWDDERLNRLGDQEGEEWKPNPTREACKALYQQWQQVMTVLNGLLESVKAGEHSLPQEMLDDHKQMILGDAYEVAAKIRSSEAGSLYILRMENAAIIRKNAQFIKTSIAGLMMEEAIDEKHGEIVREEIDTFRLLFKQWVNTFQKDEFEDEWGLF